ncbi:MAG: MBL fold metallo-hydrolase [Gemmatimonadota bacterium]|nr:MBL fold metallo-hydrolase [Gemmatimonadota bacterium]
MRLSVLGTGSRGNATLIEAGATRVLVDVGFSARELERRLGHLGVDPAQLSGVVISHDHSDHTRGLSLVRRHDLEVHLTAGTQRAARRHLRGTERVRTYRPGMPFDIGQIRVEPFTTVHDAADPVGLALVDQETGLRVGIATDLGRPTAQIRHALSRSDFLILEANHDEGMLHAGPYPWSVKSRIASSHGHLSNHAAARFACELVHDGLAGILLAHLSAECNDPQLALRVVGDALGRLGYDGFLDVALQDEPTTLFDLVDLKARRAPAQYSLF